MLCLVNLGVFYVLVVRMLCSVLIVFYMLVKCV